MVQQLFAESHRQSRKSPQEHSDIEIVPLDVRGANRTIVYRPAHPLAFGADYFRRIVLESGVSIFLCDDATLAVAAKGISWLGVGQRFIKHHDPGLRFPANLQNHPDLAPAFRPNFQLDK
jgi:hypothetical protein